MMVITACYITLFACACVLFELLSSLQCCRASQPTFKNLLRAFCAQKGRGMHITVLSEKELIFFLHIWQWRNHICAWSLLGGFARFWHKNSSTDWKVSKGWNLLCSITRALPTHCTSLGSKLVVGSEFVTKQFYTFETSIFLNIYHSV